MSEDGGSEDLLEVLRDTLVVRIFLLIYRKLGEIDLDAFVPQVTSFGFILFAIGYLLFLFSLGLPFVYAVIMDFLRGQMALMDVLSSPTLLVGLSIFLYVIIVPIVDEIKTVSEGQVDLSYLLDYHGNGNRKKNGDRGVGKREGDASLSRLIVETLLGSFFLWGAILIRVVIIPGVNEDAFFFALPRAPLGTYHFLFRLISGDLMYVGLLLTGIGFIYQGVDAVLVRITNPSS